MDLNPCRGGGRDRECLAAAWKACLKRDVLSARKAGVKKGEVKMKLESNHTSATDRERERAKQPNPPTSERARSLLAWLLGGAARRGFAPGNNVPLFKSTVFHAWSHKGSVTRSSLTESSGDLEKDADFGSKCSCRVVCTCIVV